MDSKKPVLFRSKKPLKKANVSANLLDMGMIQLNGKPTKQIAEEYGVTQVRVRQYALENDLPYVSFDGGKTVEFYLFDKEAETAFANRPKPGKRAKPKPPKIPGKPGRPRKEKPVDTTPKKPVGRPRKDATDIVPKRGRKK